MRSRKHNILPHFNILNCMNEFEIYIVSSMNTIKVQQTKSHLCKIVQVPKEITGQRLIHCHMFNYAENLKSKRNIKSNINTLLFFNIQ